MPSPRRLTSAEELKLLAGLAVQPVLAAVVAFVSFPVVLLDRAGHTLAGGFPSDRTDAAISVALDVAIVVVFMTALVVLPAAFWMLNRRRVTLTQALMFGLGFGNLPIVIGTILTQGGYGLEGVVRGIVFASLIGLTGATAFWIIAIRSQDSSRDPSTGSV
jgi:hypothetical protein